MTTSTPWASRAASTTGAASGHQGTATSNGGRAPSTLPSGRHSTSVTVRVTVRGIWLASRVVEALRQIESWPVEHAAAGVATAEAVVGEHGDTRHSFGCGSVTKLLVAYAALVAAEEGTIDLDEPAGPEGSTVRHLLAHASGLAWDSPVPIGRPGERRIYSNAGFAALAAHLEARADMPFADVPARGRARALWLDATFDGDAAAGLGGRSPTSSASDGSYSRRRSSRPRRSPRRRPSSFRVSTVCCPASARQTPNDWGLGFELRDAKSPHWTGSLNSPATFGHFGSKPGAATFLWIDPERRSPALRSRTSRSATGRGRLGPGSRTQSSAKEVQQQPVELGRALDARQVAGALDRLQRGARNLASRRAPTWP